jgi:hypothetical protein
VGAALQARQSESYSRSTGVPQLWPLDRYDELIARTDFCYVVFEMDCSWFETSHASASGYLRKYPGRFQLLRITDNRRRADRRCGMKITSTEVGRRIIDWTLLRHHGRA